MAVRTRIGVMVPSTNTTFEADFQLVAPREVTIHGQRLWLTNDADGEAGMNRMNDELEAGALTGIHAPVPGPDGPVDWPTLEATARRLIELGVSTLAAAHKTVVPALITALKAQGADDIVVFVGGVIPRGDYAALYEAGVKGIYGPGTPIPASAKDVLEQIKAHARKA